MYIQHHVEKFPNRIYHPGPTKPNRTLDLRAELPKLGLTNECDLNCQSKGIILHASKNINCQLQLSMAKNQRAQ